MPHSHPGHKKQVHHAGRHPVPRLPHHHGLLQGRDPPGDRLLPGLRRHGPGSQDHRERYPHIALQRGPAREQHQPRRHAGFAGAGRGPAPECGDH